MRIVKCKRIILSFVVLLIINLLVSCYLKPSISNSTEEVYNLVPEYNIKYKGKSNGNVIQDGKIYVFLNFESDYNIAKINVIGKFLDDNNVSIYEFNEEQQYSSPSKNSELYIRIPYDIFKQINNVSFDSISAYTKDELDCNIEIVFVDDFRNLKESLYCRYGDTIAPPNISVNKLYKHAGWYRDREYNDKFDFNTAITESVTLYAKYDVDFVSAKSNINQKYSSSVVTVIAKSVKTTFGFVTSSSSNYGVGVIYNISSNICNVLVPLSLVMEKKGYSGVEYTIIDSNGREYEGHSNHKNDPTCNLSSVFFYNPVGLKSVSTSNSNPKAGKYVIDYSYRNTTAEKISLSTVSYVDSPKISFGLKVEPSISIKVQRYECEFDSKFKGGILLDDDLRLAGISYYSETIDSKKYIYAIPIEEIYKYLNE